MSDEKSPPVTNDGNSVANVRNPATITDLRVVVATDQTSLCRARNSKEAVLFRVGVIKTVNLIRDCVAGSMDSVVRLSRVVSEKTEIKRVGVKREARSVTRGVKGKGLETNEAFIRLMVKVSDRVPLETTTKGEVRNSG